MRFLYLMIVLGFPLFDLYATVRIARWTGIPAWAWLGLPVVAGFLLLLPGVISDVLALALLALPLNVGRGGYAPRAAAAGRAPIEGDYQRIP